MGKLQTDALCFPKHRAPGFIGQPARQEGQLSTLHWFTYSPTTLVVQAATQLPGPPPLLAPPGPVTVSTTLVVQAATQLPGSFLAATWLHNCLHYLA
ncbi:hypothetical protein Scep_010506 [Stephania cephalantha]|uniref:Uncharacterized protein n=1 Tax=Stephania cephalantha TaxID=152367 RepID=A0AAP0JW70_9MAGN